MSIFVTAVFGVVSVVLIQTLLFQTYHPVLGDRVLSNDKDGSQSSAVTQASIERHRLRAGSPLRDWHFSFGSHLFDEFSQPHGNQVFDTDAILALPSAYEPINSSPSFAVTAVLAVWRRPQYLARMLDALLNQTHAVDAIWVTCFHSNNESNFRHIIDGFVARGHDIKLMGG